MLVKIEARILIFPGTDFHFPSTTVPPGTFKGSAQGSFNVIRNVTIRQSAYDFLFDFNRNHASILYRYLVFEIQPAVCRMSPILTHPACIWPLFGVPVGVTPVELRGDLCHHKTSVPELQCGFVCVILCLAVLELRLLTDRHRWTQGRNIYRASIALRGKNCRQPNCFFLQSESACGQLSITLYGGPSHHVV